MSTKKSNELTDAVTLQSSDEFIIGRSGAFERLARNKVLTDIAAGFAYEWSTNTASSDPTAGFIKANNATLSSVTNLYISETDINGNSLAAIIATWDDPTSAIHGRVYLFDPATPTNVAVFDVTGSITDNGTWDTVPVTYVGSNGAFTASESINILFVPKGDKGDTGNTGAAGVDGVNAGIKWNFESSITMGAPASGGLRLNNATFASVTAVAVNALSADSGNPSVSAYVNTFDDSSSTAHRGILIIRKVAAPQNFIILDVTAGLTDNTTWLQLAVTYIIGSGSFSAADALVASFFRTGNAGTGDMTSTNNGSDFANYLTVLTNLHVEGATGHGDSIYSILATDKFVYTNATFTASRTWTLPAANAVNPGHRVDIADLQATLTSTNTLILSRAGTDTIYDVADGSAVTSITLSHAREGAALISDGSSKWFVVTRRRSHILPDVTANLTAGFTATSFSAGTKSSGTFTPDPVNGNFQHATNGGAHTLAPPSSTCSIVIDYVNNASAGAITTSGFTKVTGDSFTTTNTNAFRCFITKGNNGSHLHVQALQ